MFRRHCAYAEFHYITTSVRTVAHNFRQHPFSADYFSDRECSQSAALGLGYFVLWSVRCDAASFDHVVRWASSGVFHSLGIRLALCFVCRSFGHVRWHGCSQLCLVRHLFWRTISLSMTMTPNQALQRL